MKNPLKTLDKLLDQKAKNAADDMVENACYIKGMNIKIKSAYFFENGNVIVYGFNGEQVSELQGFESGISKDEFKSRAERLGYDLSSCKMQDTVWKR